MVSPFVRTVKTGSGSTAVQIVEKRNGQRRILEHVGSARDEVELAVLMSVARQRLHGEPGDMLDFGEGGPSAAAAAVKKPPAAAPIVEDSCSEVLWDVLSQAYRVLGFDQVADEAFRSLVLARIIEPTSKADTVRVTSLTGRRSWPRTGTCAGRGIVPDDEKRSPRTTDLPPQTRRDRGPPHRRVRSTRRRPLAPASQRSHHQARRPNAPAAAPSWTCSPKQRGTKSAQPVELRPCAG